MAIPQGYVKIEPNTLYENVEYWIDASVSISSNAIDNNATAPYIYVAYDSYSKVYAVRIYDGAFYTILGNSSSGWGNAVSDGIVSAFPTLNINLTDSPDWLYIKEPEPQPVTKNVTITLDSGVESATFAFNEPELPKVNLRVYTTGDVSTGDYGVSIKENNIEIYNESGTYDAIDVTKQVTQGNSITVEAYGSPWFFTIKVDGVTVVNSSTDGAVYTFTISSDTSVEIYCNYD